MQNPFTLPVHPTLVHPRTGEPLRAVGVLDSGRVVWPIMGGDGTEDDANDTGGDQGGTDKGADKGGAGDTGDKGFPANTPVVEMTAEQQAAYYKHQATKHETRNKELLQITGGKYGDDLKADLTELGELRQAKMTDGEKAVDEAKRSARTETIREVGADAARAALEFALGHDDENNDQSALIDTLDLSKLLTDDGKVDRAKVRKLVSTIAPSGKGQGDQRHDFGGGSRGGKTSTGVSSGRSRYQERHGKKSDKDA
jgi:hypothetical protein